MIEPRTECPGCSDGFVLQSEHAAGYFLCAACRKKVDEYNKKTKRDNAINRGFGR